ncbi:MAG: LON peptidase substrate-binding domain-containing protein, partial [Eubacterium sp.]|nr:LON peptidase substrate-binding domain-containing protein [Eubacterium sp.]
MIQEQMKTMPILALRGMTVLPGMLIHLDVNRDMTKRAIEAAMEADGMIYIVTQIDEAVETPTFEDLCEVGVFAQIRQEIKMKDNITRIMISTKQRGRLFAMTQTKPYLVGDVMPIESETMLDESEKKAMCRELKETYTLYLNENPRASRSGLEQIRKLNDLGKLTDLIAMHVNMGFDKRQELLECVDAGKRFEWISRFLLAEIRIGKIRDDYRNKVKQEVDNNQKEYFLREQLKVIREELGDSEDFDDEIEKYSAELEKLQCKDFVKDKIAKEINRLRTISTSSSEHVVARDYV